MDGGVVRGGESGRGSESGRWNLLLLLLLLLVMPWWFFEVDGGWVVDDDFSARGMVVVSLVVVLWCFDGLMFESWLFLVLVRVLGIVVDLQDWFLG